jgi:hypothetical protein
MISIDTEYILYRIAMRAPIDYSFISDTSGGRWLFWLSWFRYAEGKRLLTISAAAFFGVALFTMLQLWLVPYLSTSGGLWCDRPDDCINSFCNY